MWGRRLGTEILDLLDDGSGFSGSWISFLYLLRHLNTQVKYSLCFKVVGQIRGVLQFIVTSGVAMNMCLECMSSVQFCVVWAVCWFMGCL